MESLQIDIKTYLEGTGFKMLEKEVQKARKEMSLLDAATTRIANQTGASFKVVNRQVQQITKNMKGFRMEFLGIMFFGMALQRMFSGLLRASFATWSTVTEGTSAAGGAVGQLLAAWEFFKFSLFDALANSGMFQGFVDFILKLVEWWGNLSTTTKTWTAGLIVAGAVIGLILFVVGQIGLGMDSIWKFLFGQNVQWGGIVTYAKQLWTTITTKLIPAIIAFGKAAWTAMTPLTIAGWATGIIALIAVLFLLKDKFGSFGAALKAWASAIVLLIVFLVQSVVNGILYLIGLVMAGWSSMLGAIARGLRNAGLDAFANKVQGVADSLNSMAEWSMKGIDLMGPTAEWLDSFGFNPQAVSDTTINQPAKMEITNADEIGRSVAEYMPKYAANTTSKNLFNDELSRQGLGEYQ